MRALILVGGGLFDRGEDRLVGTLAHVWVKKAEVDIGVRAGGFTKAAEKKLKALERENRELRQANEVLRQSSAYIDQAELDRRLKG